MGCNTGINSDTLEWESSSALISGVPYGCKGTKYGCGPVLFSTTLALMSAQMCPQRSGRSKKHAVDLCPLCCTLASLGRKTFYIAACKVVAINDSWIYPTSLALETNALLEWMIFILWAVQKLLAELFILRVLCSLLKSPAVAFLLLELNYRKIWNSLVVTSAVKFWRIITEIIQLFSVLFANMTT